MDWKEIILLVIISLLSILVLKFLVMIPVRIYRIYKRDSKKVLSDEYRIKVRKYYRDNGLNTNDIRGYWNDDTIMEIYQECYRLYDHRHRENIIDDLLELETD